MNAPAEALAQARRPHARLPPREKRFAGRMLLRFRRLHIELASRRRRREDHVVGRVFVGCLGDHHVLQARHRRLSRARRRLLASTRGTVFGDPNEGVEAVGRVDRFRHLQPWIIQPPTAAACCAAISASAALMRRNAGREVIRSE